MDRPAAPAICLLREPARPGWCSHSPPSPPHTCRHAPEPTWPPRPTPTRRPPADVPGACPNRYITRDSRWSLTSCPNMAWSFGHVRTPPPRRLSAHALVSSDLVPLVSTPSNPCAPIHSATWSSSRPAHPSSCASPVVQCSNPPRDVFPSSFYSATMTHPSPRHTGFTDRLRFAYVPPGGTDQSSVRVSLCFGKRAGQQRSSVEPLPS